MENENDSFLSKFEWNNFNITALNILLSELSQNGEVFLVGIFDNQMRPIRTVSFVNTFRVNDMGLKVVPTKTKEMQMIGIDVFDNRDNNYTIFLGTRTNIDALRSIYTKIVPPFSEGGGVGSEIYNGGNIEDYYEMNIGLKERVRKIKTLIKNRELYDVKPSLFDDANDYFTLFNAGVLTKLDLREINKNNPKTFESFKNQNLLFENGIIDNRPSTLIKVEKSCDDVSSLLDISRDIRNDLIKNVLCGDVAELTDSWSYYYENPSDLVDNLNKENEQSVIDEISRITGLEKSVVEENGISYYLEGEDENYDKDSFDNIIRVLASAQNSADNDDYYNYLYKEIENSLAELGEVHSLNYEGVKMTIDLSNRLTIDEIAESMDSYEFTDISDLFDELVARGEIDLPNFSIDNRYSAYGSNEDFNSYVDNSDFEQGYKKGGSIGIGGEITLTTEQVEGKVKTDVNLFAPIPIFKKNMIDEIYKTNIESLGIDQISEKVFLGNIKASNGDVLALYGQEINVSSNYYKKFIRKITAINEKSEVILAFWEKNNDVIINYLSSSSSPYSHKLQIKQKRGKPTHKKQKLGYGSDLVKILSTQAKKLGKEKIIADDVISFKSAKYWEKLGFVQENDDIGNRVLYLKNYNNNFELGGEITLTTEQVEQKLGRNLHWWNDDVVTINGIEYKKVFLRPEYVKK